MKKSYLIYLLLMLNFCGFPQNPANKKEGVKLSKPKLVVGVVVDQMRYDYLYKYYNKYGEGGLKKLMANGLNCKNTYYNYTPTYTAPGHASIYTGTTPSFHGIIGNSWFERVKNEIIYVTDDSLVLAVGSPNQKAGTMSPHNLLTTTIGDELRLYSNNASKVIALALKDRSAILPGGHLSNGSFWFDSQTGNFITSTYYMDSLPRWVVNFNQQKLASKYLSRSWTTMLPVMKYTESLPDSNVYEGLFKGEHSPTFPHEVQKMYNDNDYEILRYTPFGNSITKDFAISAIKNEQLGKSSSTDFLAISFSSTDYVGHKFGPQSVEVEDTYLRLDQDLAEIITYLETTFGKDGFLLFLTADHAASYVPQQLIDLKVPAGYFDSGRLLDSVKQYLQNTYNDSSLLSTFINDQIYLNHTLIMQRNINLGKLQMDIAQIAIGFKGVANAYTTNQLDGGPIKNITALLMQNGFYPNRSGDVALLLEPGWMDWSHTGTTHGTGYTYDTHVPLLWYGWHIPAGDFNSNIDIMDIAPTIATLLNIMSPNAAVGHPILPIVSYNPLYNH